jgi:hypothetical protein
LSYYADNDIVEIDDSLVYNKEARNDYSNNNSSSEYISSYDAKLPYGSDSVLICSSEDAMDRYMTALNNGNQGTIDEMITNGEIVFTEKNTKCNIVDKKITKAKVKLLDVPMLETQFGLLLSHYKRNRIIKNTYYIDKY